MQPADIIQELLNRNIITSEHASDVLNKPSEIIEVPYSRSSTGMEKFPSEQLINGYFYISVAGVKLNILERYKNKKNFSEILILFRKSGSFIGLYYVSPVYTFIPQRIYVDIDKHNKSLSYEEIENIMLKLLEPLQISTVIIGVAESVKSNPSSYNYHIVITNYSISAEDLKQLVLYYNHVKPIDCPEMDTSIYSGNHLFRLPYSTDSIKPIPYKCIYDTTLKDWELNNTSNTTLLKVSEELNNTINDTLNIRFTSSIPVEYILQHQELEQVLLEHEMSSYNMDRIPLYYKIDLLTEFAKLSETTDFTIHNYRCIASERSINKDIFTRCLKFTIEIAFKTSSIHNNTQKDNITYTQHLDRIFKQLCDIFTMYEYAPKNLWCTRYYCGNKE